jgi:hypothetical protein
MLIVNFSVRNLMDGNSKNLSLWLEIVEFIIMKEFFSLVSIFN